MDMHTSPSTPSHLARAVDHLIAHIHELARVVDVLTGQAARGAVEAIIAVVPPPALPAAAESMPPRRARPKKKETKSSRAATRRAAPSRARAPRMGSPAPAGTNAPPTRGGRRPSELSTACRTYVLQTLARHPSSMTFRELKTAVAPALKALQVQPTAVGTLLYQTNHALKNRGLLKRIAGAWAITDAGRAEVVRMREAAKAEGSRA